MDIEELSYEEAARVMECPIGTARSRVSRGRRMLQVALRDYALERGLIKGLAVSLIELIENPLSPPLYSSKRAAKSRKEQQKIS